MSLSSAVTPHQVARTSEGNGHSTTDEFFADLRAMCSLIDEADRYGTTLSMEEEYRRLRTSLAQGFRSISSRYPEVRSGGGFHGCGFEMILSSHNLDALVRNSGRRAVERLTDVWRAVNAATAGV